MKWLLSSGRKKNEDIKSVKQHLIVLIPYLWLILFFLIPFIIVFKISFSVQEVAIPPYTSLVVYNTDLNQLSIFVNFTNYQEIFEQFSSSLLYELNPFNFLTKIVHFDQLYQFLSQQNLITSGQNIYIKAYIYSVYYALLTTFFCLLMGYPIAYAITKVRFKYRNILLLLVMLPFWTSFLLRVYAWMSLLSMNGIINQLLQNISIFLSKVLNTTISIGLWDMFYNEFSLVLVLVYTYLPFMILPLYTQLIKIDPKLRQAAADLGAKPFKTFTQITWPLSKPGVIAGSMLVFIPVVGEYVVPELVGGSENLMIGKVLWQAFFDQNNWPLASAVAVVMVAILIIPLVIHHRSENKHHSGEAK
ncbi:MAG: ABC transporter permease subunit [Neisseriaceae bacterium]|nr:MAG: ABC transporter permease subunit [Neisseriaceae bacterium]